MELLQLDIYAAECIPFKNKCNAKYLASVMHEAMKILIQAISLFFKNYFERSTTQASTNQPNPSCPNVLLPWEESLSISPRAS